VSAAAIVDAHHHLWDLERVAYPWLTPAHGVLHRTYAGEELEPELGRAEVAATVIVQAANSGEDTDAMLEAASRHSWIGAVVGWAPLLDPGACERVLERLLADGRVRGVRHLIHDEADPDWIVRPAVLDSLGLLADAGLVLELPAEFPRHLEHVPVLAERHPDLVLVIDHLAKPPLRDGRLTAWADQLRATAAHPLVHAKLSGLSTAAPEAWGACDLRPAVEIALAELGPGRLMWGSDWPVSLLAGPYDEYLRAFDTLLGPSERPEVMARTATRVYGL